MSELHHYAPSAARVIALDFDGTIYPWAELMAHPQPIPGAVEAIHRLHDAGFTLVVFTSRLSPEWLDETGNYAWEQRMYITQMLERDGIRDCISLITADKLPARWYVDDRGIHFDNDWGALCDFLLWESRTDEPGTRKD